MADDNPSTPEAVRDLLRRQIEVTPSAGPVYQAARKAAQSIHLPSVWAMKAYKGMDRESIAHAIAKEAQGAGAPFPVGMPRVLADIIYVYNNPNPAPVAAAARPQGLLDQFEDDLEDDLAELQTPLLQGPNGKRGRKRPHGTRTDAAEGGSTEKSRQSVCPDSVMDIIKDCSHIMLQHGVVYAPSSEGYTPGRSFVIKNRQYSPYGYFFRDQVLYKLTNNPTMFENCPWPPLKHLGTATERTGFDLPLLTTVNQYFANARREQYGKVYYTHFKPHKPGAPFPRPYGSFHTGRWLSMYTAERLGHSPPGAYAMGLAAMKAGAFEHVIPDVIPDPIVFDSGRLNNNTDPTDNDYSERTPIATVRQDVHADFNV